MTTPKAKTRLVVELNARSAADLDWCVEREELNKTTVVNRALQVYRLIMQAQEDGESLTVGERVMRVI